MCIGSNGLPDFDALWNRTNDAAVLFFAFDLLALDGDDLRPKPLLERKNRLSKLLRKTQTASGMLSIWRVMER